MELAQFGVTNTAVTPEPDMNNLVSHKCRAAAVSWCSYIPSQVCSRARRSFFLQSTLTKPDQAAAALMTHFVCLCFGPEVRNSFLAREGAGRKQ